MERLREVADLVVPLMLCLGTGLAICVWYAVRYLRVYEIPAAGFAASAGSMLVGLPLVLQGLLCLYGVMPQDRASLFYLISGAFLSVLGVVILVLRSLKRQGAARADSKLI